MENNNIDLAVLFLIFNRPKQTFKVFEQIRLAKPNKLFIAADGARKDKSTDKKMCEETRKIVDLIDWDCEIKTLFRDENLGCNKAVISAIDWFFEYNENGIILEDDCFPELSFFKYAKTLLKKYQYNEKVMHISGTNFIKPENEKSTYYFSHFGSCWGWATWRSSWLKYKFSLVEKMTDNEFFKMLNKVVVGERDFEYFKQLLSYHRTSEENIWDWRWTFSIWNENGIVINPSVNLIENIGYGEDATSSTGENKNRNAMANLKTNLIDRVIHPEKIIIDIENEKKIQAIYNPPLKFKQKIKSSLSTFLPKVIKQKLKLLFR